MKDQQAFLSNLLDFSNVASKRTDQRPSIITPNSINIPHSIYHQQRSINKQAKKSHTDRLPAQQVMKIDDSQINNGNQKLLKTFNTLRQKLNLTNRQNITLKQQIDQLVHEVQGFRQKQKHYLTQIQYLNKKSNSSEQQCNQYKARLHTLKQSVGDQQQKADQVTHLKLSFQRLVQQNKQLKKEASISMQISINQKLQLQDQIQTLKLRQISLTKSQQQAQNQLYSKNKELIKMENQYKRLKITYEEQVYLKKLDSQSVILMKQNQQLKLKCEQIQTKLKKEKNKKHQLQSKLLQLQQRVRLFGTKTDIYQGQIQVMSKKIKQVQKDQVQTKKQANQAINQKLSWEQKFYNSLIVCEQLISRVKRQLIGDAVELARTCQFRLNKLKNDQKLDLNSFKSKQRRSKSASSKKTRSKTIKSIHKQNNLIKQDNQEQEAFQKSIYRNKNTISPLQTVLKQKHIQKDQNNLQDIKKRLFNQLSTPGKNTYHQITPLKQTSTNLKQTIPQSQKIGSPIYQLTSINNDDFNLQAKIRKQRELMERKLRQKILYHKIQDATNEPLKHKLRQEHFTTNEINTF